MMDNIADAKSHVILKAPRKQLIRIEIEKVKKSIQSIEVQTGKILGRIEGLTGAKELFLTSRATKKSQSHVDVLNEDISSEQQDLDTLQWEKSIIEGRLVYLECRRDKVAIAGHLEAARHIMQKTQPLTRDEGAKRLREVETDIPSCSSSRNYSVKRAEPERGTHAIDVHFKQSMKVKPIPKRTLSLLIYIRIKTSS